MFIESYGLLFGSRVCFAKLIRSFFFSLCLCRSCLSSTSSQPASFGLPSLVLHSLCHASAQLPTASCTHQSCCSWSALCLLQTLNSMLCFSMKCCGCVWSFLFYHSVVSGCVCMYVYVSLFFFTLFGLNFLPMMKTLGQSQVICPKLLQQAASQKKNSILHGKLIAVWAVYVCVVFSSFLGGALVTHGEFAPMATRPSQSKVT